MWKNDFVALSVVLLFGAALALPAQRPVETFETAEGMVEMVPVRHASLMLRAGGEVVHVDPVASQGGNYEGLPPGDLILITHTHGDHLDPDAISKLRKSGTIIVAPPAAKETLPEARILANGEGETFGNWRVEAVPAYNLVRKRPNGDAYHPKGEGNGYVLTFGGQRFYIAGDTENIPEMQSLKDIAVALLPMNQPYTMTPEEAADAAKVFQPKIVYPYHCRGSNLEDFKKALAGTSIETRILDWYY